MLETCSDRALAELLIHEPWKVHMFCPGWRMAERMLEGEVGKYELFLIWLEEVERLSGVVADPHDAALQEQFRCSSSLSDFLSWILSRLSLTSPEAFHSISA